jgi:hypothetical protein
VHYPPTPSLGWIGQIKVVHCRWLQPGAFLGSVFLASEKFDSDSEPDVGVHKTKRATRDMMGMGMGMGTRCRSLVSTFHTEWIALNSYLWMDSVA